MSSCAHRSCRTTAPCRYGNPAAAEPVHPLPERPAVCGEPHPRLGEPAACTDPPDHRHGHVHETGRGHVTAMWPRSHRSAAHR